MPDYMTLMGAEEVSRAGHNMASAAHDMKSAASHMDDAFRRHQMFLDDWLYRFEAAIAKAGVVTDPDLTEHGGG